MTKAEEVKKGDKIMKKLVEEEELFYTKLLIRIRLIEGSLSCKKFKDVSTMFTTHRTFLINIPLMKL